MTISENMLNQENQKSLSVSEKKNIGTSLGKILLMRTLIEQLNKIAAGDKTMIKKVKSYNQIHKSYITAIENNRFDDLIQARQGHKHKSLGEDKYKNWFK